jgi:hypothetical protein
MTAPLPNALSRTLAQVLDELVPPSEDGRLPGAGALGLAAHVDAATRGSEQRAALEHALARLAEDGFEALAKPEKLARTQALAKGIPAVFNELLVHTYGGYYHHPRVVAALGLPPRPPFPQGYAVAPTDFALLDPVRRRAPFYRKG